MLRKTCKISAYLAFLDLDGLARLIPMHSRSPYSPVNTPVPYLERAARPVRKNGQQATPARAEHCPGWRCPLELPLSQFSKNCLLLACLDFLARYGARVAENARTEAGVAAPEMRQ